MRGLARSLGACTPDDEDLQAETVHLLAARDADIQASKWTDLNVTIVEAILGFIHEGRETHIYVGDIAKAAEAILLGRGERCQVEARRSDISSGIWTWRPSRVTPEASNCY